MSSVEISRLIRDASTAFQLAALLGGFFGLSIIVNQWLELGYWPESTFTPTSAYTLGALTTTLSLVVGIGASVVKRRS